MDQELLVNGVELLGITKVETRVVIQLIFLLVGILKIFCYFEDHYLSTVWVSRTEQKELWWVCKSYVCILTKQSANTLPVGPLSNVSRLLYHLQATLWDALLFIHRSSYGSLFSAPTPDLMGPDCRLVSHITGDRIQLVT